MSRGSSKASKVVAIVVMAVLTLVNVVAPAASVSRWLTPWPVQLAYAQAEDGEYIEAADWRMLEGIILGLIVSYLFWGFVGALEGLMDWFTP